VAEPPTHADCDIAIAGGGPAGAALALALADGRRRVSVIEARAEAPHGDTRATALSAASVRLLDALGVWPALAPDAVAIRTVEVSQQGHYGRTRLRAADVGLDALGRVVAYPALAGALADAAQAAPGVEWLAPARVSGAQTGTDRVALTVDSEATQRTRAAALAVAADGTRSPLRQALGIETRVHDYAQTAVLATVDAGGDAHTGFERFTADGPLALLPAGGRRRTLVWTRPPDEAAAACELPAAAFAAAVAARLGRSHGPISVQSQPAPWPLQRIEATRDTAARVALVGNAARTLHPVGAQGFNLALRDVCSLAAALEGAADPGAAGPLADWARARRGDRWRTRTFTDVLARGFVRGGRHLGGARAGALLGLDGCGPARDTLTAQTTGLLGGLPRVGRWHLAGRP